MAHTFPSGGSFTPSSIPQAIPVSYVYSDFSYPTSEMHNRTLELLDEARKISTRILQISSPTQSSGWFESVFSNFNTSGANRPAVNIDCSDRSFRMFNSETHVHNPSTSEHSSSKQKTKEKKDDSMQRIIFGVIGLIAFFTTAYFGGKAAAQGEELSDKIDTFEKLKNQWNDNRLSHYIRYPYYAQHVDSVVSKAENILQRAKINRTHKLALLVFAFIAGSAAVAGSLIGSKPMMATAVVIASATAVAGLFKFAYTSFSKRDKNDAEIIQKKLMALLDAEICTQG